jgi:hypothetical protein
LLCRPLNLNQNKHLFVKRAKKLKEKMLSNKMSLRVNESLETSLTSTTLLIKSVVTSNKNQMTLKDTTKKKPETFLFTHLAVWAALLSLCWRLQTGM